MELELSRKEFRRLIDMAYIGNWVLNSMRENNRFTDYDNVQTLLFEKAKDMGMTALVTDFEGETMPSRAYVEGGIHTAIIEYESYVFYDMLAEDLARRDMGNVEITPENILEFFERLEIYLDEFEEYGTERVTIDQQ